MLVNLSVSQFLAVGHAFALIVTYSMRRCPVGSYSIGDAAITTRLVTVVMALGLPKPRSSRRSSRRPILEHNPHSQTQSLFFSLFLHSLRHSLGNFTLDPAWNGAGSGARSHWTEPTSGAWRWNCAKFHKFQLRLHLRGTKRPANVAVRGAGVTGRLRRWGLSRPSCIIAHPRLVCLFGRFHSDL